MYVHICVHIYEERERERESLIDLKYMSDNVHMFRQVEPVVSLDVLYLIFSFSHLDSIFPHALNGAEDKS